MAASPPGGFTWHRGGIIRGDSSRKEIALVFTGDEFADGGEFIAKALADINVKASFFFTGNFYRNFEFAETIKRLNIDGHYLGAHSDQHLLYCDWSNRDSLLVTKEEFTADIQNNYEAMAKAGIATVNAKFFLPPYEWYNDTISKWTAAKGLQLVNFTPGTLSTADYTFPELKNYRDSESIFSSIVSREERFSNGLNGFILLVHIGTDPRRTDKFYHRLPQLIDFLKLKGYSFRRIDELLSPE